MTRRSQPFRASRDGVTHDAVVIWWREGWTWFVPVDSAAERFHGAAVRFTGS